MVPGIVLAAGLSTRMGEPKALLPAGRDRQGPTFVRQIVTVLLAGGASDALIVGRPEDDRLRNEVESLDSPARFIVNEHADRGQLSSLLAGLNAADRPGVHAVLVTPVDVPFVSAETIRALIAAAASGAALARPTYGGRHGHPVVFARALFDELRHADPDQGARAVVHAHHADVVNIAVDDRGVLHDIDRPDDYQRAIDEVR